jgi:hypothetical protein
LHRVDFSENTSVGGFASASQRTPAAQANFLLLNPSQRGKEWAAQGSAPSWVQKLGGGTGEHPGAGSRGRSVRGGTGEHPGAGSRGRSVRGGALENIQVQEAGAGV